MKKIFISGKITGEPIVGCLNKFDLAAIEITYHYNLRDIIVPLRLPGIHFGISHEEAMKICLAELETCDAIYMLKDWEESKGAKMEHEKAKELRLEIIYEK